MFTELFIHIISIILQLVLHGQLMQLYPCFKYPKSVFYDAIGISFTHNDSGPNFNYYTRVTSNHLMKYRPYYYVSLYVD